MQVFEAFARERRPLTSSELAQALDLAGSNCSDLVHSLIEAGYLLRTPKGRLLHPTSRLGDLVQRFALIDPLQIFASEALKLLSERSGETSMGGYLNGAKSTSSLARRAHALCATCFGRARKWTCIRPHEERQSWESLRLLSATP